jgi:glycosyltransferase involved in cell wall biosynthesis
VRIALDATYSIGDELSGVGIYSRALMSGLAKAHPEARFDFCYRSHRYFRAGREFPRNVRRCLLAEPWGPRGADLFHGLNQRLPGIPLKRAVATFHDLFVLTGDYSTPEFRDRFAAQARDAAKRASLIVTVSEFTRQQVIGLLRVEPGKVRVVHHGIRRLPVTRGIREPVIFTVGAIQKRKNTIGLVEAFETLDRPWKLVLAGSQGYGAGEILERISRSSARDRILLPGYVSPEQLAGWYARASIFAFPSMDEGFGMPVLEAMAAGVPVITSNCSALPEVAGDAALLVNPAHGDEIAEGLQKLICNESLRLEYATRGFERASEFNWDKAVQETWRIYEELLRS